MFVNYVADSTRSSPLNVAVARVVLAIYVIWRIASLDVRGMMEWPTTIYSFTTYLYPPARLEWLLVAEKWLLVLCAGLLLVGHRTRVQAFLVGILLAHLTGVTMLFNRSGETQQMAIASLLIVLFGLFAEQDKLSVDGFRATRNESLQALNGTLQGSLQDSFRADGLRYMLLTLAILYAGSAWAKIDVVGLSTWAHPDSLARHIRYYQDLFGDSPLLADAILSSPELLTISTWGTLIAEFGLLITVLAGVTITPIVLILLGMHTGIVLTMGIFFFDIYFFLITFAAFDRGYTRLVTDREIDLVYDEHCVVCARSLYLFKLLDINGTVSFYSQYDAPSKYQERDDVAFDEEMYVFVDGKAYGGYWSFRELCRQFWFTKPLAAMMGLWPVATIGERIYRHIAAHRNRYFVCDVGSMGEEESVDT